MKTIILKQIKAVFEAIDSHRGDPVALMEDASRLLTANYNLGDLYINAKEETDSLDGQYKAALDTSYLFYREEHKTVEDAKALARRDNLPKYAEFLEKQAEARGLSVKRIDISEKVSVLQSYCSHLRDQYLREGRQNSL